MRSRLAIVVSTIVVFSVTLFAYSRKAEARPLLRCFGTVNPPLCPTGICKGNKTCKTKTDDPQNCDCYPPPPDDP